MYMLQNICKEIAGPRPVEVVTSVERRRRRAAEEKSRIVAAPFAPGISAVDVARQHDISPQHLHRWRRAARAGKLALPLNDDLEHASLVVDQSVRHQMAERICH